MSFISASAEVRRHDDDALRHVHAAVIAKRQRAFVENFGIAKLTRC